MANGKLVAGETAAPRSALEIAWPCVSASSLVGPQWRWFCIRFQPPKTAHKINTPPNNAPTAIRDMLFVAIGTVRAANCWCRVHGIRPITTVVTTNIQPNTVKIVVNCSRGADAIMATPTRSRIASSRKCTRFELAKPCKNLRATAGAKIATPANPSMNNPAKMTGMIVICAIIVCSQSKRRQPAVHLRPSTPVLPSCPLMEREQIALPPRPMLTLPGV